MPDVKVEIQVWCSCGEGLCGQSKGVFGGIHVEPCPKCLEEAKKEGFDEGYSEGYDEGVDQE